MLIAELAPRVHVLVYLVLSSCLKVHRTVTIRWLLPSHCWPALQDHGSYDTYGVIDLLQDHQDLLRGALGFVLFSS